MNVYIPWTYLNPPTWDLLADLGPVGVDVSGDDGDYLRYFQARWNERLAFVNVAWCAYGYERPGQFPWFGVVRFRPAFMELMPAVWDELAAWAFCPPKEWAWRLVGEVPVKGPPPGQFAEMGTAVWQHLDQWLLSHAERLGLQCHRHYPDVRNTRSRPGYDLAPTAPH